MANGCCCSFEYCFGIDFANPTRTSDFTVLVQPDSEQSEQQEHGSQCSSSEHRPQGQKITQWKFI